ncbi:MAG: exodeoxyribonuclease VII large subunit, partial [Phycisphaerales bacterium]|nr:exodeoxyribonuclease VII large subunit [Phycisphaerales bacterium]
MSMLPFDASRMKASRERRDEPLTVSQLAQQITRTLETMASPLRIRGEVSGLRAGTHWYFSLKDAGAVVSCVMFASRARRMEFTPSDGDEVVIEAKVDFYAPSGRLSLIVDRIAPVGAGALEARFQALCAELRGLGWFDDASKRPLPSLARRVAVITSATGAAIQDVLDTAR